MGDVTLFRKIPDPTGDGSNGLHEIAADEKLFVKPTLVCCGGLFSNVHHKEHRSQISYYIKAGLALLGAPETVDASAPFDVVGMAYPKGEHFLGQNITSYGKSALQGQSDNITEFATHFAQKHLFPLVEDEQGKARDISTIKRNLRRVHFMGTSYGSVFIQQVGDTLAQRLQELGLSDKDIKDTTSQIVVATAGATLPPATGKASFTTVSLINHSDTEVNKLFRTEHLVADMLAKAPEDMTLLVDAKNKPVHRADARTHEERLQGESEMPATPFTITPVSQEPHRARPDLKPDSNSNFFLASMSRPWRLNGYGDVVLANDPLNPRGTLQHPRGNPAEATEFQGRDDTWHSPKTYLHYNREQGKQDVHPNSMLARTLVASVLTNSMNNAIKNEAHPEKAFEPLPPMKTLIRLPVFARYDIAPDADFRSFAGGDYNDAITRAMTSPAQLSLRGR